jgi:hypothetical protein
VESYGGPHLEKVHILAVPKKGGSWKANEALKSFLQKRYAKFQEQGARWNPLKPRRTDYMLGMEA